MPETLYPAPTSVSALDNIPRARTRKARNAARSKAFRNAVKTFRSGATEGVFTETWDVWVKNGIEDAAHAAGVNTYTVPGQSVTLWWAPEAGHAAETRRMRLHGALWGHWDTRDALAVRLVRPDGRSHWLLGLHTAPIKPRYGRIVVRAAERAHQQAYAVLREFVRSTGFPVVMAGDWNDARPLDHGLGIPGAHSYGEGIIRVVTAPGANVNLRSEGQDGFDLESDHEGVRVDLAAWQVAA